ATRVAAHHDPHSHSRGRRRGLDGSHLEFHPLLIRLTKRAGGREDHQRHACKGPYVSYFHRVLSVYDDDSRRTVRKFRNFHPFERSHRIFKRMAMVFVTGSTGYLGRTLIGGLLARKHGVRALARRGSEGKLPAGCEVVSGDALDAATYQQHV